MAMGIQRRQPTLASLRQLLRTHREEHKTLPSSDFVTASYPGASTTIVTCMLRDLTTTLPFEEWLLHHQCGEPIDHEAEVWTVPFAT